MRFHESSSIFQYSWNEVAQAIWRKYPNPESSHVLSEDTVARHIIGNKMYSKRLLTKTNRLPKWGERLVKSRNVNIVEESIVDPVTKEVHTYTRNIGLTKYMTCIERVTYKPCPNNPDWTIAERKAWIDSKIFGFGYAIQKFGLERYRKNVEKTTVGFSYVLRKLFPSESDIRMHLEPKKPEDHTLRLKEAARETAKRAKEMAQKKAGNIYVT